MKSIIFVALLFCALATKGQSTTTFILVRHAEKENDGTNNPDLSDVGKERAQDLLYLLKDTKVDAVYSTNFKRTLNTVSSLTEAKNLSVKIYDPFKMDDLEKMMNEHKGGTIVIVGHSNNIPRIANWLTASENYKDWKESDYDNVLIISAEGKGKVASALWLHFGKKTGG